LTIGRLSKLKIFKLKIQI